MGCLRGCGLALALGLLPRLLLPFSFASLSFLALFALVGFDPVVPCPLKCLKGPDHPASRSADAACHQDGGSQT